MENKTNELLEDEVKTEETVTQKDKEIKENKDEEVKFDEEIDETLIKEKRKISFFMIDVIVCIAVIAICVCIIVCTKFIGG